MFLTSFLLSLPVLVSAISSGRVSDCFITPDYGCPAGQYEIENGVENRLKCKIPSRIMAWVTEPINKPEWYTLFAGSNEAAPVTTYVPGQRMTIGLRVKAYNQQYRGLLMYAYKGTSKEEKVGEWDFVDRDTLFHSWCPQSVLHAGANLKPYLSQWVFTAPPKGTGQISIWALLKIGVANEGEFYYPNLLTLNEATTEPPAQVWYRASKFGQSCDEVCNENCGKTCDATQLQALDTPDKFEAAAAAFYTCAKPYLTRCGVEGATSGNDSTCYYHSQAACQRVNLPFTAATCGAKPTNAALGFRLCPCTGGQTPCAPRTTPAPITTTVTRRTLATNAPGATNAPAPIDPCLTTTQCASGCPCPSPRVCQPGLTLKEGVCLAAGACDVAEPGNGCPCTDKCGTATVAGQTENLACKAGFCTLVLRRTCDDHLGTAGCWCTEKRTCDAGLICSSKNNNCVLDEECAPGSQGCTCMQGKCNDGLACSRVAGGTFCLVEEDAIGTNPDSASALVLSLASIAVVLLSMM